jgi:nitroreductase
MKERAVIDTLLARTSIRKFRADDVPESVMTTVLECAVRAPTAAGRQWYSILRVKDKEVRKEILRAAGDNSAELLKTAPELLFFNFDTRRLEMAVEHMGGSFYFDGPISLTMFMADPFLAAANAMTAAEALGLGSVFVGTIHHWSEKLMEILEYPRHVYPMALLCLGYPAEHPPLRDRLPLESVLHIDRYTEQSATDMRRDLALLQDKFQKFRENNPDFRKSCDGEKIATEVAYFTCCHYRREAFAEADKAVLRALRKAGFRLTAEESSPEERSEGPDEE